MNLIRDAIWEALRIVHNQDCDRGQGQLANWSMHDIGQLADRLGAWIGEIDDE